ncbi:hypothetical protein L2E82_12603 [Cichorium intybus]|uniref:Uncharacterized protein n=1 Tax=Cichorium intybus TaxID=13427 RepID=A0ACB9GGN2_CICIN|nr:hypothetical protein L2E82_12603 [Cichorium intybus]
MEDEAQESLKRKEVSYSTPRGYVCVISSIDGLDRGQLPGGLAYASSKIGVVTLVEYWAGLMCSFGVEVL